MMTRGLPVLVQVAGDDPQDLLVEGPLVSGCQLDESSVQVVRDAYIKLLHGPRVMV